MRLLLAAVLATVFALPAASDDTEASELTKLMTAYDARGWEAVGRLNIGWGGMCTGALIAPDVVLTAGHCLYSSRSGDQVDPTTIEFLAGWRNGRASASRQVYRAVVHPDYDFSASLDATRVRNDLALLELRWPIRNGVIRPFRTGISPNKGDRVGVVSYAKHRSEAPSLQEVCNVLGRQEGVLVTTCTVDFGSSGAPIFSFDDGEVQIVSVVSAKAEAGGQNVSLGTSLTEPLIVLKEELAASRGFFSRSGSAGNRLQVGGGRGDSGAKFVKP